ncbi:glycosyltransferase family 2 protein [soil metagenome]
MSKKISILIPCHNEEGGIGKVLTSIPYEKLKNLGYDPEVIIIDNNCTDRTAAVAKKHGAQVIFEPKKGKGNAMRTGFLAVSPDSKYVVMLDGDNTYKATEIPRLLEPLESKFCDVVVGSRLGGVMKTKSLRGTNRAANWGYTFLVRHFYHANVTDVLSGFFAWKRKVTDDLAKHTESTGFSIEMDMITKTVLLGYTMCSVPITYDIREGETKIEAFRDGIKIMAVLMINLIWHPARVYSKRTNLVALVKQKMAFITG